MVDVKIFNASLDTNVVSTNENEITYHLRFVLSVDKMAHREKSRVFNIPGKTKFQSIIELCTTRTAYKL